MIEERSTNTLENLKFGIEEIRNRLGQNKRLGFISIPYHMLRVKLAAIKLGIDFGLYYPDTRNYIKDIWPYSPFWKNKVMEEIKKIGTYCRRGDIASLHCYIFYRFFAEPIPIIFNAVSMYGIFKRLKADSSTRIHKHFSYFLKSAFLKTVLHPPVHELYRNVWRLHCPAW